MTKEELIEAIVIVLNKCKSTKVLKEILDFVICKAK